MRSRLTSNSYSTCRDPSSLLPVLPLLFLFFVPIRSSSTQSKPTRSRLAPADKIFSEQERGPPPMRSSCVLYRNRSHIFRAGAPRRNKFGENSSGCILSQSFSSCRIHYYSPPLFIDMMTFSYNLYFFFFIFSLF